MVVFIKVNKYNLILTAGLIKCQLLDIFTETGLIIL